MIFILMAFFLFLDSDPDHIFLYPDKEIKNLFGQINDI